MEADAGLIQNISHPHQTGANLGGQPDSLGLTAGQRTRGSGQGQIVQSHINQEINSGFNLL